MGADDFQEKSLGGPPDDWWSLKGERKEIPNFRYICPYSNAHLLWTVFQKIILPYMYVSFNQCFLIQKRIVLIQATINIGFIWLYIFSLFPKNMCYSFQNCFIEFICCFLVNDFVTGLGIGSFTTFSAVILVHSTGLRIGSLEKHA